MVGLTMSVAPLFRDTLDLTFPSVTMSSKEDGWQNVAYKLKDKAEVCVGVSY